MVFRDRVYDKDLGVTIERLNNKTIIIKADDELFEDFEVETRPKPTEHWHDNKESNKLFKGLILAFRIQEGVNSKQLMLGNGPSLITLMLSTLHSAIQAGLIDRKTIAEWLTDTEPKLK